VEDLDSTAGIIAIAAAALAFGALVVAIRATIRLRRLAAGQRAVLGEGGSEDLVAHGLETRRRVDELAAAINAIAAAVSERMEDAETRLDGSISRAGVLRYDAFNESTGRQSSSVALLDEHGNGVVLSAIRQREQARVYAKPIAAGDSELELSPEERQAMRVAEENAQR
jgi:hypothetical protein